ncbi:vWA domain-containing protein, partial [Candidatus Hakubella thermalkaliphila]
VVMDTSGSMATEGRYGTKLKIAKEGVKRALKVLSPDDLFSLIAFHSKPELILPFDYPLKEREKDIDEEIEGLQAGGGTDIIEALKEAAKTFEGIEATNKQLLLISDGIAPEEGLEEVLLKLKDQKVEVVAIGVGQDANLEFLKKITAPWGGKVYYSPEGETLPEIASREVGRIKASYLYLKPFNPKRASSHHILKEISDKDLRESVLSGYLRTTLKEGSQMIIATSLDEPLVAVKEVGLGKSLVYTADGEGRLSGEFLNSSTFNRLLAGMVRELFLQEYGDVEVIGEKVVYYSEPPLPLNTPVVGTVSGQTPFKTRSINFERQGINSYEAVLPYLPSGSYFLRLTDKQGTLLKEVPLGVSYPREYLITSENFILPSLKNQEGVTVLGSFNDINKLSVPTGKNIIWLRSWLLLLSIIFFLLELSLRMLGIKGRDILKKMFPKRTLPTREEIDKRKRFLDIFKGDVFTENVSHKHH